MHTIGLTAQIRAELARAVTSLTSNELHDRCDAAASTTMVASALNRMWLAGELIRTTHTINHRFVYSLNPGFKGRKAEDKIEESEGAANIPAAILSPPSKLVREARQEQELPAPVTAPSAPPASPPASTSRPPFYSLFDHISVTLSDLDDLAADAIDHGAKAEVMKCLLASQGALRRAQEAIYRETRL